MLRVGMTNPPFILEHLDTIAQVLNHPNVFSFLHVPVQVKTHILIILIFFQILLEECSTLGGVVNYWELILDIVGIR